MDLEKMLPRRKSPIRTWSVCSLNVVNGGVIKLTPWAFLWLST